MTLITFCNRCNTDCDKSHTHITLDIYHPNKPKKGSRYGIDKSIDLCPKCFKDFEKFMTLKEEK